MTDRDTLRDTLPSPPAVFPAPEAFSGPEDHLYGPQAAHRQHHAHQQLQTLPQHVPQHPRGLYAAGLHDDFYPGQLPQQQEQSLHPSQYQMPPRPVDQHPPQMPQHGMGFDAGTAYPPMHQQRRYDVQGQPAMGPYMAPGSVMSQQPVRQLPAMQAPQGPQQQRQHHGQQHMYQGLVPSPQLRPQPSPQPPPSSARPRQQHPHASQPPTPQHHHRQPQALPPPKQPPISRAQLQPSIPQPHHQPLSEPPPPPPIQEPRVPVREEIHFVNPQDILQAPPPPPMTMGGVQSLEPRAPPAPVAADDTIHVKILQPSSINPPHLQPPPKKTESKPEPPRTRPSPQSSVSNSPALPARSPSISKKSPAMPPKPRPVNTGPIMVAIAEECLDKARSSVHEVAMTLHPERVDEYQKLIATGLSCLQATLQNSSLSPREEARVRLRYAATLQEETDNLMEAEMALGKGITLCDKHRLIDLKYCMQYLMLKVLFQRNHKAALKAVDGHISDCETFKHVQWFYAFRLLKATFYMEMENASDAGALENLRSVQHIANTRGDNALCVLASIMEGLCLLKTPKDSNIERVQACLAQAAKFQFDPGARIMQLDVLTLLLDVASSLHHQSPDSTSQKLRLLQKRVEEYKEWRIVEAEFLVPIKKQPSNAKTVSVDTVAIVKAGEGDSASDYLVMSFMTNVELRSLVFTLSGLENLSRPSPQRRQTAELWRNGLNLLDSWDSSTAGYSYGPRVSLATAIRQRAWRTEAQAYLNVLLGLLAAGRCQWEVVKQIMARLGALITPATQPAVRLLSVYLTGVYHQGTGDLQGALRIFLDGCFALPGIHRNDQETQNLIQQLQPHCTDHWNIDLRAAWHNVVAALETDPPQQLNQQKQHIHAAFAGSRITNNILGSAVTLCIMRSRFFENVIGEQALKSARAASMQAQRSGNILWQSVADGMLAQSYEVQGQRDESRQEWEKGTKEARDAFAGNW